MKDRFELTLADSEWAPDSYPELGTISPAFFYRFVMKARDPNAAPEYVYVPLDQGSTEEQRSLSLFVAEWNMFWEGGSARPDFFLEQMPPQLAWLRDRSDLNIRLAPRGLANRYGAYAVLYHMLPRATLQRCGLPMLRRGLWPPIGSGWSYDDALPAGFDSALARAFSLHLWPFLQVGSRPSDLSASEPIRLLAHNLDFWVPYADRVAQARNRLLGRVRIENEKQRADLREGKRHCPRGWTVSRPLRGGALWLGEEEAAEATRELVEVADREGRLRAIIDAVRSNRVEDDFSPRWSFAKEDFERKLYRKRSKTKVTFVELDETIPFHGPDSEVDENLLWEDFFAILNAKERRVVVCLRNGMSKATEIAATLGYANHSPVSKTLQTIRRKAARLLTE